MTTLVLGATGATGSHVVKQLLLKQQKVRMIARQGSDLHDDVTQNPDVDAILANVSEVSEEQMVVLLKGCNSVVCCLGHNLSFRGIYGKPRRLVTDAIKTIHHAVRIIQPSTPMKLILMNSSGVRNKGLNERVSLANALVIFLLRYLLPPHADNEQASAYLEHSLGTDDTYLQWLAVRPDALVDENQVSHYVLEPSPIRDAIFNAGKVSRISVAHLMAALVTDDRLWAQWKFRFPVVYGQDE